MDLGIRLKNIIDILPDLDKVADIGTDHGYVLIKLIKKNKIKYGIASDNKIGPLNRAKKNAELYGIKNKIDFRLGSGLSTVKVNEVNGAIFAGMGSYLIKDLIEKDIDKIKKMDCILIQPAQNIEIIREYIYNGPFKVIKEDMIKEEDRFYQYILFKYDGNGKSNGESPNTYINKKYNYKLALNYPEKRNNIILEYLDYEINNNLDVLNKITENNEKTEEKKEKLYNEIKNYEEIKNGFKS
ncbi:MAG: SAM-dependent methyltransferase [Clostridium sp.]|nr:SAM-dependent methyltransferase [Clostridium sp.]